MSSPNSSQVSLSIERELDILNALRAAVAAEAPRIQLSARALAALDVLASLAEVASNNNYAKPHVHDGDDLVVVDSRHPVVERHAAPGSDAAGADGFVPNDITLNGTTNQLVILTGPNMGGKSTYLRQAALLCLMAQTGSFVPARDAKLPIVDRIFARVGASDNIARGQSTFMVEMQETANILHQRDVASLVVLDEIGRGTATFDGLSIAWAVAEHLATNPTCAPKTLFATHYHELTDLADATPGVVNFHVAVARVEGRHRVPAQNRPGTIGSQLRHSGRPPRRASRDGHRAGARNPAGARARRIGARRPAVGQRYAHGSTAAARTVSGAPARLTKIDCSARARSRRRRPADAARGADPARRA